MHINYSIFCLFMNKTDTLLYRLKKIWYNLRGDNNDFPLQNQMYHSFSVIIIGALCIMLPINLFLNLKVPAILCGLTIVLQSFVYSLSRFKGRLNLAILISCIQSNIFLCINYFFNAGIAGPTLLICSINMFVVLMVVPKKQMFYWFAINLLLASAIVIIEYKFPKFILGLYIKKPDVYINNLTGYIVCILLLYVGITYIRNSYEQEKKSAIEKTSILEKLNNEKNKLFSIISHDLKTPLASIQQYLDLITHTDVDLHERKWIEKNLLVATTSSLDLLNNLFAWCKTQMEGCDVNLENLNLNKTIKKTIDLINVSAKAKNITLNSKINEDVFLKADANMLLLVIRNLLHNAIKFTPNNGMVCIEGLNINDFCKISIVDTGVGMSDLAQKQAFTLKINSTYGTNNETGTGLGLVLCEEYTHLQNGKIWFTSKLNEGTVFNLEFPA